MPDRGGNIGLASIPDLEVGPDFALETLRLEKARAQALLDLATRGVPPRMLIALDRISRQWLAKWNNAHLDEIDAIAQLLGRPGAYFFSINYEWGCSCKVAPSPDHTSARLIRVLDWRTPGLGRNVVAARVRGAPAGPFVVLTWPGYSGVLQGMAPGRFSAAMNQAPMRKSAGFYYLDWLANRRRVWKTPHGTPAHLLRAAFEDAPSFAEALRMLSKQPVSTPAIFTLAGTKPHETAVIERTESEAYVHRGRNVATNHWQAPLWRGHPRGRYSADRACLMHAVTTEFDASFSWLEAPVLNDGTRLVMIADAGAGRVMAQGYEGNAPATAVLDITL
jgi:hypothetical protein